MPVRKYRSEPPSKQFGTPPNYKLGRAAARKTIFNFKSQDPGYIRSSNKFRDILRGFFGRQAWYVTPSILGCTLPTVEGYASGKPVPLYRLERLRKFTQQLPAWLEEWREKEMAEVEAEYRRRKDNISAAVTELRLFTLERERLEAERASNVIARQRRRKARREAEAGRGDAARRNAEREAK